MNDVEHGEEAQAKQQGENKMGVMPVKRLIASLSVSVMRQLVIILPAAFILSKAAGLGAMWWSFPIAEVGSLLMSSIFFRKLYQSKIKTL